MTPPFSLFESSDKIGFGVRRLFPEQSAHHFGPLQGLEGVGLHFAVGLLSWAAFGLVLVPAAVVAWRHAPSAVRMLLVASVVELLGYVMFWGPWNFSFLWGKGTRVLGPIPRCRSWCHSCSPACRCWSSGCAPGPAAGCGWPSWPGCSVSRSWARRWSRPPSTTAGRGASSPQPTGAKAEGPLLFDTDPRTWDIR